LIKEIETIALYCRVSTDDQNVKQQHDLLKQYCKGRGIKYSSFIDKGISGKISDRPAWNKLIRECEQGKFKTILISKFDRVTRSLKYSIEFIEWLKHHHTQLISLYDGTLELTPDQIFTFKLKCLMSEYELDVLKWRSKIGIDRAKKQGKYKGGAKGRSWKCSPPTKTPSTKKKQ